MRHLPRGLMATTLTLALGLGAAAASDSVNPLPLAAEQLLADFPGVQVQLLDGRPLAFYGSPMNAGQTADEAAALWLTNYGAAFGVGELELAPSFSGEAGQGRFTVFGYNQFIEGVPVEYGIARVLVNNDLANSVVYVAGRLAMPPAEGFAPIQIHAEDAIQSVAALPEYQHLPLWSDAELAVFAGESEPAPAALTWKFVGEQPDLEHREKYTFFVNAASGGLVHVRNEVVHTDVQGTVKGYGSPGLLPDMASNPPVLMSIPEIRVRITGGNQAYADRDGNFTITNAGTTAVTVTTKLGPQSGDGRWVWIDDQASTELSLSLNGTPPGPFDFVFNTTPSQYPTAQVNAFIHGMHIHNYFKDRAPAFTGLDTSLRANVNLNQTCNAFYDGSSINFFRAGGGCNNTAYTTVVAHEYGHHIVNRLFLSQGAFGEGYSDVCAMLLYDDPIIARFFTTSGGYIRYPDAANVQYPCPQSGSHYCGQILGGVWWTLRENYDTKYGAAGLALAQQLHVDWSLITIGGIGANSAHPQTAIEVLTINDTDGNLANGTPDYEEICHAFGGHSIDCPEVTLVTWEYPNGLPTVLSPTDPTAIDVNIVPVGDAPVPSTAAIWYSVNGGAFVSSAMSHSGGNAYVATIPAQTCGDTVEFYFAVDTISGQTPTDPETAPALAYQARSAIALVTVLDDDFETDLGWSDAAPDDDATGGRWMRGDPQPTAAQPGDDHTEGGTLCWVTDWRAGLAIGANDVDNGKTTLTSPTLDVSTAPAAEISYWRWYSNDASFGPNEDVFEVDVSNDDGTTWTNVETVGPAGEGTSGGWFFSRFRVSDFVTPTATVKVRFVASDYGVESIVEAAVDDVQVVGVDCGATGCDGDVDGDGDTDFNDLVALLASYGINAGGDLDNDGDTDFNDLVTLLGDYGCQP